MKYYTEPEAAVLADLKATAQGLSFAEAEKRRAEFRDKAIQALGVGSTAAVDKALGIESEGEASGEELALNIISSLEAQVKAEQGRIIAAGGMFGDYFRQGFNGKFAGIVDELVSTIIEELAEAA